MNEQPHCPHYHAGKRARAEGRRCINTDRRLSPKSRESWYAGWTYQHNATQGAPPQALIEQNGTFFAGLRVQARAFHESQISH